MLKVGDRIELVRMNEDPNPIPSGTKGVVKDIQDVNFGRGDNFTQIDVKWDNGRRLMVVCPPDLVRKVG